MEYEDTNIPDSGPDYEEYMIRERVRINVRRMYPRFSTHYELDGKVWYVEVGNGDA